MEKQQTANQVTDGYLLLLAKNKKKKIKEEMAHTYI